VSGGAGFRLRFLAVVVLPAAVLMALEIVSSRLLAPAFGNSVYVWGSIIGVFLAAMSGGYVLGGAYADRRPELPALARLLLAAALFQWATAIFGRQAVAALGAATGGRPAGTLLAATLLFAPATLLLATVSPFGVRLAGIDRSSLGNVSGGLFALSTAGSLLGTLLATFVLIPMLGLDAILALLVAVTALSAAFAGGRSGTALAAIAVAVTVTFSTMPHPGARPVLVERATPYQLLVVREQAGVRTLVSNGVPQAAIQIATGMPTMRYFYSAETLRLFAAEPRELLLLGLGSGGVGRLLTDRTAGLAATYVEIDPAVVEIAAAHFGFRERPGMAVALADGRRFVGASARTWDWIYCDTYIGQAVPFHLATREFFLELRERLAPGGAVGLNLAGSIQHPFSRAIYRTLRQVFEQVEIFAVQGSGNFLLIARMGPPVGSAELQARAAALDSRATDAEGGPRFAALAGQRLAVDLELSDVPVLEDGYAPVDALLNLADDRAAFDDLPGGSGRGAGADGSR
jgi:spermidine synthase